MKKKREIDGKINLHSPWIGCGFKKLKKNWFIKLNLIIMQCYLIVSGVAKIQTVKTWGLSRQKMEE